MTNFRYLNVNPDKSIEQDCVIRAIKRASGIPYNAVSKLLKATAQEHGCDELCVSVLTVACEQEKRQVATNSEGRRQFYEDCLLFLCTM